MLHRLFRGFGESRIDCLLTDGRTIFEALIENVDDTFNDYGTNVKSALHCRVKFGDLHFRKFLYVFNKFWNIGCQFNRCFVSSL